MPLQRANKATPRNNSRAPMLTVEDIASELHLSHNEVRNLIGRGAWVAMKCGKRWLTRPADLEAYLTGLPRNRY